MANYVYGFIAGNWHKTRGEDNLTIGDVTQTFQNLMRKKDTMAIGATNKESVKQKKDKNHKKILDINRRKYRKKVCLRTQQHFFHTRI